MTTRSPDSIPPTSDSTVALKRGSNTTRGRPVRGGPAPRSRSPRATASPATSSGSSPTGPRAASSAVPVRVPPSRSSISALVESDAMVPDALASIPVVLAIALSLRVSA